MLQTILKQEFAVDTIPCRDAAQLVQRVEAARPSMVLLDVALHHLALCLEVITKLRSKPQTSIPVVTVVEAAGVCKELLNVGADECIVKPFDIDTLFDSVRKHLGHQNQADLGY
jgi:DNA-binding response OmpR family regulator